MAKLYTKNNIINFIPLYLFLIAIVLFRIPSFYFLPGGSALFTTQVLARILIAFVFLLKTTENLHTNGKIFSDRKTRTIILLVMALFLVQSLSIVSAINYEAFLFRYLKDALPGLLTFFTFYFFRSEYRKIIFAIVLPIIFNSLYQFITILDRNLFMDIAKNLIYDRHLSFILYNLGRGRIYIDTYDEAAIPLLLTVNIVSSSFPSYLLLGITAFFSFISNWRIRIIMLFFSLVSTFIALKKVKTQLFLILLFIIFSIGYLVNLVSIRTLGFSFLDRLTLQEKVEDVISLSYRTEQIKSAFEMGLTSPFGVGLGNYYDNLTTKAKTPAGLYDRNVQEGTEGNLHNIFAAFIAESGYISLVLFLIILVMFVKSDIKTLKRKNKYKRAFVISFWTIFIFTLLNPNVGGAYQVFFWGTRGLLLK